MMLEDAVIMAERQADGEFKFKKVDCGLGAWERNRSFASEHVCLSGLMCATYLRLAGCKVAAVWWR
jgi:hypothetical protein